MASNAAARRRYAQEIAAVSTVQTATICKLPANIMLHIFKFLDVKTLCTLSKVCRQWHHFASDRSLWKVVDLKEWPLALRTLWKIVRNRLTDSVTQLHIRGFLGAVRKGENISSSLLSKVKVKCASLEVLTLCYCDLSTVHMRCLPGGLRALYLDYSIVPLGWFESLKTDMHFPNLVNLHLTNCSRLSDTDLSSISRIRSLEQLNLSFCYRIGDPGIREIAESLQALVKLCLTNCPRITNLGLHCIGRHLTKLESLNLASCRLITDAGIASLVHSMLDLEYLDLTSCRKITDNALHSITIHCKKLQYLSLAGCWGVTKDGIEVVKSTLPHCEIQEQLDASV